MSLGVQYFLLSFVIIILALAVIGSGVYAKWDIVGPRWKRKFKKLWLRIKKPFDKNAPKIKKGAVIASNEKIQELERKIRESVTPQELLEAENAKLKYDKEISLLQEQATAKSVKKSKDKVKEEPTKEESTKSLDDLLSNVGFEPSTPETKDETIKNEKNVDENTFINKDENKE